MRSVRKVAILLLAILLLPGMLSACGGRSNTSEKGDGLSIVTTVFPLYDWTRAVLGEEAQAQVTFLLDTGVDLHSFQPTAADLLKISGCDLFLYVGGASDGWVVDALRAAPREGRMELGMLSVLGDRVRMEELVEGMAGEAEEEPEADEHVWVSLKNAARLVDGITEALCALDGEEAETYRANAAAYIQKLTALDQAYENAVSAAGIRTLLFGDRFPFRYMADDYGLSYYAAFSGCSAEADASFETVLFLAGKLDELDLPAIVVLEGADGRLARAILENSENADRRIVVMDSLQSTTAADAQAGVTYLAVMEKNLTALQDALR